MGTLLKLVSKQAHWNCLTLSCALCEFYLFMQIDRIKCTIPICVDNLQSMTSKIFNMVMRVERSLPTMMHSALYIYVQKWWHIFNHITLKLIKVLNDLGELSHSAQANVSLPCTDAFCAMGTTPYSTSSTLTSSVYYCLREWDTHPLHQILAWSDWCKRCSPAQK